MSDESETSRGPVVGGAIERDVIRVTGPDAATFLQGQLSQDVSALAVATATWSFVLHPEGKVHSWVRITKTGAETFVLDVDGGFGDGLDERLRRFLIRTDALIEPVDWPCVAVRGVDPPRGSLAPDVFRLPLARSGGYDLIGPGASVPDGVTAADPEVLEMHRVLDGVPAMGRELTDDVLPAEIGQWIVDASVSFTKGCFVGQELVARIDSRGGNAPRHLRAVTTAEPVTVGDSVAVDGPASAVTSVASITPVGPVALAFLGRRVEVGDAVSIAGVAGTVRELPLCASTGS